MKEVLAEVYAALDPPGRELRQAALNHVASIFEVGCEY
jgi:hypothetical protein